MATGDVPDLIRRYFPEAIGSPTTLSKATGGRVTPQSCDTFTKGTAKFLRLPADDTIMGLTDALKLAYDDEVLLAFARSGGRLRIRDSVPLLVRELQSQGGLHAFDAHPALVAAIVRALAAQADALLEAERGT